MSTLFVVDGVWAGGHGRSCASMRPRHTVLPVHKCPPYEVTVVIHGAISRSI